MPLVLLLCTGLLLAVRATASASPTHRFGHSTVVKGSDLYMFGGYSSEGFHWKNDFKTWDYSVGLKNDLYKFNGSTWSKVEYATGSPIPDARAFHSASISASGNEMIIHGGSRHMWGNGRRGGTSVMKLCGADDTWKYTFATKTWTMLYAGDGTAECDGRPSSSAASAANSVWGALTTALLFNVAYQCYFAMGLLA